MLAGSYCGTAGYSFSLVTVVAWVTAVARTSSLAWELPHATGAAKIKQQQQQQQQQHFDVRYSVCLEKKIVIY